MVTRIPLPLPRSRIGEVGGEVEEEREVEEEGEGAGRILLTPDTCTRTADFTIPPSRRTPKACWRNPRVKEIQELKKLRS